MSKIGPNHAASFLVVWSCSGGGTAVGYISTIQQAGNIYTRSDARNRPISREAYLATSVRFILNADNYVAGVVDEKELPSALNALPQPPAMMTRDAAAPPPPK